MARSFAAIYVVVIWGDAGQFRESDARSGVQRALPRIEALTVSLPPPNPEPAEGAGKLRA